MGKTVITSVRHGVEFLGVFIKPWRWYISRKTLKMISKGLKTLDYKNKESVSHTINSYLGILRHVASYNIRRVLFLDRNVLGVGVLSPDLTKIVLQK